MKIYVSGTFTDQARLRLEAIKLLGEGHEVTGSWLQESKKPEQLSYDEWMFHLATKDVAEVFAADCIICDLDNPSTSGGRYVEWGVACHPRSTMLRFTVGGAIHKEGSYVYGCFNHLAHKTFRNWDEVHAYLKGIK